MRAVTSAVASVVLLSAATVMPPAAVAGPPARPSPILGSKTTSDATTVTLVTGDRVAVTTDPSGRKSAVVVSADPDPRGYLTRRVEDDLYVVPGSAAPLLAKGRLDERLFNVTGLIEQGYDDRSTSRIPLIAADGATPRAAKRTASLSTIDASALTVEKRSAEAFWRDFANPRSRSAGIDKLWLDGKVYGNLDRSTKQIGATKAWAAGYTGKGTRVAILDGGYDEKHADLADRVKASKNFTDRPNTHDEDGHGTHVASIVGGSGRSGRQGVAPGADLLVGRVLAYSGGQESWIIAGMEWAIAEQAKVVNLSLGTRDPSNCTDPLAEATKRLVAQNKALFVIAAGNTYVDEGITSPGCVPGVLTVGAVDRDGRTADFSAKGPAPGSHVLKPEIAAPGVGIMAANYDTWGDIPYQPMSGTSMASPHVAGAAAILAGRRPDLDPQQLRAMLISTATPGPGGLPFQQGAGIVDVSRAIEATVYGPGAVDVASFTWPQTSTKPVTKNVTYHNFGSKPVQLRLSLSMTGNDDRPAPLGMARLGKTSLTVPAKGSASVPVTVDPRFPVRAQAYGRFGGRLVAHGSDGSTVMTPVAFWLEPKTVELTVKRIGRNGGKPAEGMGFLDVFGLDNLSGWRAYSSEDQTFRVRAGSYAIAAMIPTSDADGDLIHSVTYAGAPEIRIDRDQTLVLDARQGRQVTVDVDRPAEQQGGSLAYGRWDEGWSISGSYIGTEYIKQYYAVPDRQRARRGHFELGKYLRMFAPSLSMRVAGGPAISPEIMRGDELFDGKRTVPLVDAKGGSPEDFAAAGVRGKLALVHVPDPSDADRDRMNALLSDAAAAGAAGVLVSRDAPGRWAWGAGRRWNSGVEEIKQAPGLTLSPADAAMLRERLAAGPVDLSWTAVADSPYVYNLAFFDRQRAEWSQHHRVRTRDLGRMDESWFAPRLKANNYADFVAAFRPWDAFSTYYPGVGNYVRVPRQRTSYYSAGDTEWKQFADANPVWGAIMQDRARTYRPGQRAKTTWYKHPMQTGIRQDEQGRHLRVGERQANLMGFEFPNWQDAEPDHFGWGAGFGDVGGFHLYRDGKEIGWSPMAFGQVPVPATPGRYLLDLVTERYFAGTETYPNWRLSLATQTKFSFTSSNPGGENVAALPLLLPDYDVAVDAYNLTPAVASYPVRLTFAGQPDYSPGPLKSVQAWASSDDGETFVPVPVKESGSAWIASVDNRIAAGGYVTLKVAATDSKGNSVEQTVKRAYGVR
jgi:hypothetical protein